MPVPGYETYMLPLLRLAAVGEVKIRDCVDRIAQELNLSTDAVNELLPSGKQTRFANRVHWAKTYLTQAKLLETTGRGRFKATERGIAVLRDNPDRIDNNFLAQFPEFQEFATRHTVETQTEVPAPTTVVTPEESIEQAFDDITDELRANLLERIRSASPAFFERLIVDLLIRMGYGGSRSEAGRRVGGTGDGGIDGIINEDPLGLDVVYLQAKRYGSGNLVTPEQLRAFSGSLLQRGASKGVFVTTSTFTEQARESVRNITQQRIVLIDGDELTTLLVKHGVGVRIERMLELKKIDLDYFDEEDDA
jgi:restriction system protein